MFVCTWTSKSSLHSMPLSGSLSLPLPNRSLFHSHARLPMQMSGNTCNCEKRCPLCLGKWHLRPSAPVMSARLSLASGPLRSSLGPAYSGPKSGLRCGTLALLRAPTTCVYCRGWVCVNDGWFRPIRDRWGCLNRSLYTNTPTAIYHVVYPVQIHGWICTLGIEE